MKKIFALFPLIILCSISCQENVFNPMYIQLDDTYWSYETETQIARVAFTGENNISVLQKDLKTGYVQSEHGYYTADGHRVVADGQEWTNQIKFIRTFSHLKNVSTQKNLTEYKPRDYSSIAGSVWTTIVNGDLRLAYLAKDGTCIEGAFFNIVGEEGVSRGWKWTSGQKWELENHALKAGPFNCTLFKDFLVVDTLAVYGNMAPSTASGIEGTNTLEGTVWVMSNLKSPYVIIFTSSNQFVRVRGANRFIYATLNGTYELDGNTVSMHAAKINETCQIESDKFIFSESQYVKVTFP